MRTLLASLLVGGTLAAPQVVAKIPVAPATSPCAAASGAGFVWVSEYSAPYLLKIDPATNKVVKKIHIGDGSCGLGFGAGSLWVEDTTSGTISRVSAATGKRTAIKVDAVPYDSTFAYGADWVTSNGLGKLDRVSPRTNKVVKRFPLETAVGVVAAFGSVWAAGGTGVIRVDPATNKIVAKLPVAGGAGWTAASDDAVWVTSGPSLLRIDPATNTVAATIKLPTKIAGDPDVVAGQVWVPLIAQNAVAIVDPATNTIAQTVPVGTGPFVVTQIGGEAWIPSWKGVDIWRVEP